MFLLQSYYVMMMMLFTHSIQLARGNQSFWFRRMETMPFFGKTHNKIESIFTKSQFNRLHSNVYLRPGAALNVLKMNFSQRTAKLCLSISHFGWSQMLRRKRKKLSRASYELRNVLISGYQLWYSFHAGHSAVYGVFSYLRALLLNL